MSDRPIIFSAPMIRALLDGRKTQTRRVLKPHGDTFSAPSYRRGDRLYVREAAHIDGTSVNYRADHPGDSAGLGWRPSIHMPRWASRLTLAVTDVRVQRLQDISEVDAAAEGVAPLFTPEQAAARPELNFNPMPYENYLWHGHADLTSKQIDAWSHQYSSYSDARRSYSSLWERLHGPGAWDANPWVVAISFTVQRGNIDQIGGDA